MQPQGQAGHGHPQGQAGHSHPQGQAKYGLTLLPQGQTGRRATPLPRARWDTGWNGSHRARRKMGNTAPPGPGGTWGGTASAEPGESRKVYMGPDVRKLIPKTKPAMNPQIQGGGHCKG